MCIPREVIEEHILQYLPPKALLRFRCVDKRAESFIKALLNDPKFLSKHSQNFFNTSTPSLIFGSFDFQPGDPLIPFNEKLSVVSITSAADDRRRPTAVARDLPPTFRRFASFYQILHCNGVLCLVVNVWNILLWNPVLRDRKLINTELSEVVGPRWGYPIVGFGHESVADDYKFVIGISGSLVEMWAMVYRLNSDEWTEVDFPDGYWIGNSLISIAEMYHGGFHYWLIHGELINGEPELTVLTFDYRREVFGFVRNLPAEIRNSMWSFKLVQWNGGVALVSYPGEMVMPAKTVEIWAMDGDRVWRRVVTIGPFARLLSPVVFWKASELLMEEVGGRLVSYNLNDNELDVVSGGEELSYFACTYVPTLVSVLRRPRQ